MRSACVSLEGLVGLSNSQNLYPQIPDEKDPHKPNLKKEFFRTWLVSSKGASMCFLYIYIINMKSSPHFWAPCVSHDASRVTRDPLTHKCPPPAGIGYLQLSSGHDVFHGFWLKPVLLHDMSVETFLRTPRTSMVQLIPFILLG